MAEIDPPPFSLLRPFPTDDDEFASFATTTLAALGEAAGPEELERRLRECYPSARVRVQERLGMNGGPRPHWYVFRDGRLVPERPVDTGATSGDPEAV